MMSDRDPVGGEWPALFSWGQLLVVWAPIAVVTTLHYLSAPELAWVHDVARRLYYIPIILCAFANGLRGGLVSATVVTLLYSPHAFLSSLHALHGDPGRGTEKVLEIVLYLAVGVLTGLLVDRERRERTKQEELAQELSRTLEERKAMELQLVRSGRLAALGELTAGIAHELRNPLQAMRSTAEIVLDALPADAEERRMQTLHLQEIDRLSAVAGRFLDFARPRPLQTEPVDVPALLRQIGELTAARGRQSGIQLTIDASLPGPTIPGDREQLVQVFLNIVLNAFQAMEQAGRACCRDGGSAPYAPVGRYPLVSMSFRSCVRGRTSYCEVLIENNGPPIPAEILPRMFDPFVTSRAEGAGLGLSLASRIVDAHNGYIEAENTPDGVRFTVGLPTNS